MSTSRTYDPPILAVAGPHPYDALIALARYSIILPPCLPQDLRSQINAMNDRAADIIQLLGEYHQDIPLPRRQRRVLDCLLRGDSEKQIALRLGIRSVGGIVAG